MNSLSWNELRSIVKGTSEKGTLDQRTQYVLNQLIDRLEQDYDLHERQYSGVSLKAEDNEDEIERIATQVEQLGANFDQRLRSVAKDLSDQIYELRRSVDKESKSKQAQSELLEWESRIVSQLDQLPIRMRPDFYHAMANFIAGEDVARLKDLFHEARERVEAFHEGGN